MIGAILLAIFICLGTGIANRILLKEAFFIRFWAGGIIGLIGMMWLVVPFSFIFSFNVISHIFALLAMIALYILIRIKLIVPQKITKEDYYELGKPLITVLPICLLIFFLLNSHVLFVSPEGNLMGGQSTFGDLSMHLSMITSIATQGTFPPNYSIFHGAKLAYPFLVNALSSSFYLFGASLRLSVLIPSFIMVFYLVLGFYILSYELLKNHIASLISSLLFFLNGGFGFIYFLDGLRSNPDHFNRMFTAWYNTPTNYNEHFIRWSNVISDMIIPQRTTMAGWTFVIFLFWLGIKTLERMEKNYLILLGTIAGLLPMIHTHSFLGFGIIMFTWFLVHLFEQDNKLKYVGKWFYFGIPAVCFALPQLMIWTFPQASTEGFFRYHFNWANEGDLWLWFWIKNVGIVFLLALPAFLSAEKKLKKLYLGPITLFIIADFFVFQPNLYDNNKLFYLWYIFTVILVSGYMITIYKRLRGIKGRWLVLAFLIFIGCFSGILTLGREANSGDVLLYTKANVETAEFIKQNTEPDSLFLTNSNHLNTVASLSGRNIFCGSAIYVFFHGLDYNSHNEIAKQMFEDQEAFKRLSVEYQIDYIYFSEYERNNYEIDYEFFKQYPLIYGENDILIYAISQEAIDFTNDLWQ